MDDRKGTPKAVILSAILHLGIVGFLALAIVPCSFYESLFETLHLPAGWNPIACAKPLELPGQIIEATLIGPTGAPPPKTTRVKPVPDSTPPPPAKTSADLARESEAAFEAASTGRFETARRQIGGIITR